MTENQRDGLQWIADHEPVGRFTRGAPTKATREKLEALSLVGRFKIIAGGRTWFRLTEAGWEELTSIARQEAAE